MKTTIGVVAACAMLGACAGNNATGVETSTAADTGSAVSTEQQARISELERSLANREAEINRLRSASDNTSMPVPSSGADAELFPPNPKPGQCYARVLIPARYNETTERVLISEASSRLEIIPASYETVTERVLVKEASTRLEVVPATYTTVEERVLVRPATTKLETIPATYKTVSETVQVSPARTEWKRGPASSFSGRSVVDTRSTDTGEIMCLVEVPARFETVTRKVVDTPARTREVTAPAEYKLVTKQVLATPATTREVTIPAEYGTVEVTKLATPATERKIDIPAEYKTVTKRAKVTQDVLEWRQVVCDVNLNASNVRALQSALRDAGTFSGSVDGVLGPQTLGAANAFARSKGLPAGSNYIAMEVIDALDLDI